MIFIYTDGSSNAKYKYVGTSMLGFRVENMKITEFLFVEKSEFSGAYCHHSLHEMFAMKKAIIKAQDYPNEPIVILNDSTLARQFQEVKMGEKEYPIITHYLEDTLDVLYRLPIQFKLIKRDCYGIQLADILSKVGVTHHCFNNLQFQAMISHFIGHYFDFKPMLDLANPFGQVSANYKQRKPKHVTLIPDIFESDNQKKKKKKAKSTSFNFNNFSQTLKERPDLLEPPPKLTFSFN